jgi:hypothetical protein
MLIFAVAVRRVLRKSGDGGYLSELFLVGSAAVAGLWVVAMAMQAAVTQRAEGLAVEVVFAVGFTSSASSSACAASSWRPRLSPMRFA